MKIIMLMVFFQSIGFLNLITTTTTIFINLIKSEGGKTVTAMLCTG